jgi:hypothetical protein
MRDRMRRDPVGQQILAERPRVTVRFDLPSWQHGVTT